MAKKKRQEKKPGKPVEMIGIDYGVPATAMLIAAPDFNANLRASDIIACVYGEMYSAECSTVIPVLGLACQKPDRIKAAFEQFRTWIDATGSDALKIEILYQDQGYLIGLGPDVENLLWRLRGLDQMYSPAAIGMTYIKRIDSRNPLLERIAEYSRHPVAPIYLSAVQYRGSSSSLSAPDPDLMVPIENVPPLLLLNVAVYKTQDELPSHSSLRQPDESTDGTALEESRAAFEAMQSSIGAIRARREERLSSLAPMTLHKLRTHPQIAKQVRDISDSTGLEIWQVEQAAINQRIWAVSTPSERYKLSRQKTCMNVIGDHVELDSMRHPQFSIDENEVRAQATRDLTELLNSIDEPTEGLGLPQLQCAAERRGYLLRRGGS